MHATGDITAVPALRFRNDPPSGATFPAAVPAERAAFAFAYSGYLSRVAGTEKYLPTPIFSCETNSRKRLDEISEIRTEAGGGSVPFIHHICRIVKFFLTLSIRAFSLPKTRNGQYKFMERFSGLHVSRDEDLKTRSALSGILMFSLFEPGNAKPIPIFRRNVTRQGKLFPILTAPR